MWQSAISSRRKGDRPVHRRVGQPPKTPDTSTQVKEKLTEVTQGLPNLKIIAIKLKIMNLLVSLIAE